MSEAWSDNIYKFLVLAGEYNVRMILVGGGAVNFHGYQRHSADIDFWIDTGTENLNNLIKVFQQLGYDIQQFPTSVSDQEQNISVKFSPTDLNLELITRFDVNKSFEKAYQDAEEVIIREKKVLCYRVLSLEDLITSKIRAGRPKNQMDIKVLKSLNDK